MPPQCRAPLSASRAPRRGTRLVISRSHSFVSRSARIPPHCSLAASLTLLIIPDISILSAFTMAFRNWFNFLRVFWGTPTKLIPRPFRLFTVHYSLVMMFLTMALISLRFYSTPIFCDQVPQVNGNRTNNTEWVKHVLTKGPRGNPVTQYYTVIWKLSYIWMQAIISVTPYLVLCVLQYSKLRSLAKLTTELFSMSPQSLFNLLVDTSGNKSFFAVYIASLCFAIITAITQFIGLSWYFDWQFITFGARLMLYPFDRIDNNPLTQLFPTEIYCYLYDCFPDTITMGMVDRICYLPSNSLNGIFFTFTWFANVAFLLALIFELCYKVIRLNSPCFLLKMTINSLRIDRCFRGFPGRASISELNPEQLYGWTLVMLDITDVDVELMLMKIENPQLYRIPRLF